MPTITSVTQFFPRAVEGFTTTLTNTISAGATTLQLNGSAGYSIGDVVVMLIEPGTSREQAFTGTMAASNTVNNVVWTKGTNTTHNSGSTVVDYITSTAFDMVTKGIQVQHNQDGSHSNITATSLSTSGTITEAGTNLLQSRVDLINNYIVSGGIWTQASGLNGTMTAAVLYMAGYRLSLGSVASRAFTASKDTYVDILLTGTTPSLVYTEVTNGATAPTLAANSMRLAKVVTSGAAITSVTQSSFSDGIGNIFRPVGPISFNELQNPVKFSVWRSTGYTVGTAPSAWIADTKEYDTSNSYNTTTGNFTAPVSGFYDFAFVTQTYGASATAGYVRLYVNGSVWREVGQPQDAQNTGMQAHYMGTHLNAGDTAQIQCFANSSFTTAGGEIYNYFAGRLTSRD
jgi:hypothetical protein